MGRRVCQVSLHGTVHANDPVLLGVAQHSLLSCIAEGERVGSISNIANQRKTLLELGNLVGGLVNIVDLVRASCISISISSNSSSSVAIG
jgi:hypothetical protein